jgi:hypothetical protein
MKGTKKASVLALWRKFLAAFKAAHGRLPTVEDFHRHLDETCQRGTIFGDEIWKMEHRQLQEVIGGDSFRLPGGQKVKRYQPVPVTLIREEEEGMAGEEQTNGQEEGASQNAPEQQTIAFDDLLDIAYEDQLASAKYQLNLLAGGPRKLKDTLDHYNENLKPPERPPIQLEWISLLPEECRPECPE